MSQKTINKKNKLRIPKASIILVIIAFLVLLHQKIVWGTWWSWEQFLHHENFAFGLVCIAFGIFLAVNWKKIIK
jgi:hypothetical protein